MFQYVLTNNTFEKSFKKFILFNVKQSKVHISALINELSDGTHDKGNTKLGTYPSGEYSKLKTAPWVCVLRFTESVAGLMEE